ncbi:MAG: hypothetical protein Q7S55_03485 [Nanoarchaeota archaeon]|nr:hypothetical protein [Nanoarchaeota archaeon]
MTERIRAEPKVKITADLEEFRVGDITGLRENSYELGVVVVKRIETPSSDKISRMIETNYFSTWLQEKFCRPELAEIKPGDAIFYARAGNMTLALLDIKNYLTTCQDPAEQKLVQVDDRYDEGVLGLYFFQDQAMFHLNTSKMVGNRVISPSMAVVAVLRNPILLYHNTEL